MRVLSNGCWEWTAAKSPLGYGFFGWQGKQYNAHRFAYQWLHGWINDRRKHLDHFMYPEQGCIGPSCANPEHVRLVTSRENTLRGAGPSSRNLAKTHCDRGHEFTPENTKMDPDGQHRRCFECSRDRYGFKGNLPAQERDRCAKGHPYDEANTYLRTDKLGRVSRNCRACRREGMRKPGAVMGRPRQTHCNAGHEYTEENTYTSPAGRRNCRTCQHARGVKYRTKHIGTG